jgi:hypothetical protein
MSLRKPSLVLAPKSSGFPWVKLELMLTLFIPTPRLGTKQPSYNDKKIKQNFSHIQGNSDGIGCKVIYGEGIPIIHEEMHKYFHHI